MIAGTGKRFMSACLVMTFSDGRRLPSAQATEIDIFMFMLAVMS